MILFNAGLYLACSFDSELLRDNIESSYQTIVKQGPNPVVFAPLHIFSDNNTETIIINEMYSVDSTEPFVSAMKARKNYKKGLTYRECQEVVGEWLEAHQAPNAAIESIDIWKIYPHQELGYFLADQVFTSITYGRYWHGYLCLYRPLFLFFDLTQVRMLLFAAFVVLYGIFLSVVKRRFGSIVATIFGLALLFSGYFTVAVSLQCALNFVVTTLGAIVFVKRIDRIRYVYLYIFTVACLVNYVDFLTAPLMCLGVLSALYLLKMREDGQDWRAGLVFLVRAYGAWLLGYGGMWLAKWIQYDLVIDDGQSMLMAGLLQSAYRFGNDFTYCKQYKEHWLFVFQSVLGRASFFALVTATVVMWQQRFTFEMRGFNKNAIPFLALALVPLTWYCLLVNHTTLHFYFTYRMTAIYVIGLLLAMNEMMFGEANGRPSTSVPNAPRPEPESSPPAPPAP